MHSTVTRIATLVPGDKSSCCKRGQNNTEMSRHQAMCAFVPLIWFLTRPLDGYAFTTSSLDRTVRCFFRRSEAVVPLQLR